MSKIPNYRKNWILDGKKLVEVDLMTWAKWFEQASKDGSTIVKQDELPNGKFVSTVFLGIDHGFGFLLGAKADKRPVVFETMVFSKKEKAFYLKGKDGKKRRYMGFGEEVDMQRYHTYREAEIGHKRMVAKWSNKE